MNEKKTITTTYNLLLFVVWFLLQFTVSFLSYKQESNMLIDTIFDYNFLMGVGLMLTLFVLSAVIGVWVIRSFWERFVSHVFNVRPITVGEALSVVLVFLIFTVN